MEKPDWVDKILIFFCKLFHRDFEEESNKLKRTMCMNAQIDNMCNKKCESCAWHV